MPKVWLLIDILIVLSFDSFAGMMIAHILFFSFLFFLSFFSMAMVTGVSASAEVMVAVVIIAFVSPTYCASMGRVAFSASSPHVLAPPLSLRTSPHPHTCAAMAFAFGAVAQRLVPPPPCALHYSFRPGLHRSFRRREARVHGSQGMHRVFFAVYLTLKSH
jgi:hypothetical protein